MDSEKYMNTWKRNSILIGSPTNLLAAALSFIPVLYLCMRYDCWPPLNLVLSAWGMIAVSFGAFYFVEPISYYASLGMTGTYLSFLSGNIGNMRMPCASLALDITNSQPGTIQAEIVSTMAISGSIITNLIATTSAAIIGTAVVGVLPAFIKTGLQSYAAVAIFGATFGNFAVKNTKLAVIGFLIPLFCKLFLPLPAWLVIIISVFSAVVIGRIFYVIERKKAAA